MRMARLCLVLALWLGANALWAQLGGTQGPPSGVQAPPATPEKESFVIQPKNLATGAKDVTLRLVCNTASGFNTSSSRPPELKFGAGVTLKPGSFTLLNPNEAECRVDVADDAFGTCAVSLELYSVNGTQVLSTLRATLGIGGPVAVTGSQAKVGAESVELVRVNVSAAQKAGTLVILGRVAGTVRVNAPTGTAFVKLPAVSTSGGDINTPALSASNTVLTFGIGNPSLDDITVRVAEIEYNTQLFGLAGGTGTELACEISGAALSNQSALVVNAHTALTTVAGKNDTVSNTPAKPTDSGSQGSNSTTPQTPQGNVTQRGDGRSLESNTPRTPRQPRDQGGQGGVSPAGPVTQTSGPQGGNPPPPPQPGVAPAVQPQPQPQPAPAGGPAAPAPAAAAGGKNAADGSMRPVRPDDPPAPGTTGTGRVRVEGQAAPMVVSPGLYFCDKDFNVLGAVVLDKTVGGEAGGRVWILLKRAKDKDPTRVETVTVKLKVCGVERELVLTETGKDTGEFRCGKEGVLLLAPENPDSNTVEAPAEPARPRLPR
jgi:hypothetical protein